MFTSCKTNVDIAHKQELISCETRCFWCIVKKCNVPNGRKKLSVVTAFLLAKMTGSIIEHIKISQAYSQMTCKDFQVNYAPVILDITLHLFLIMMLIHSLESE